MSGKEQNEVIQVLVGLNVHYIFCTGFAVFGFKLVL